MSDQYQRLSDTLREIFQMDRADLDFGIYRIMNMKRQEMNDFLEKRLLTQVEQTLRNAGTDDSELLQKELTALENTLRTAGVEPDNNAKVLEMRITLKSAGSPEALTNEVFSHLTAFFRRYYHQGDFISQRRYKKDVYAIPYEGEEVKLHWANHDQYYIKTGEHFRNYSFRTDDGRTISFNLRDAATEKDNNKGKNRFFRLCDEDFITEEGTVLKLWFTYEPTDKKEKQDDLNRAALDAVIPAIPAAFRAGALKLVPTEKNKGRTLLEKHLTEYTARNTFDYFIHKDLGGFLTRELDFYIKNELLHIDDIDLDRPDRFDRQLRIIKGLKRTALDIIALLAQLENFQKRLWLKKKFVVQSDWCITLDRIPEQFYADIAANTAQREEWVRLFAIDEIAPDLTTVPYSEPLTLDFLKANPYLLVDTKFYPRQWKYRLLGHMDNLDERTDGLLINSENFQALNLLQERFENTVRVAHIDPPYNTETSGFLYKNTFQHSSWSSMMIDRCVLAKRLLVNGIGHLQVHIDENEYERLFLLLSQLDFVDGGSIVWDKRNPMNGGSGVARQHEYIVNMLNGSFQVLKRTASVVSILSQIEKLRVKHVSVSEDAIKEFASWIAANDNLSGGEKAYKYLDENWKAYQSVSLRAPEPRTDEKFFIPLIHPITLKPCSVPPNGFSRTPETLNDMVKRGEILFGKDESTQPRQKALLQVDTSRQLSSIIQDAKKGKYYTDQLGIEFPYCHPVSLYEELLGGTSIESETLFLDYFSGSGTTGHAVINLNREDGGKRKYILVEMGTYFNTVTKLRIEKVVYSEGWKDGKPTNRKGSSHCFRYMRLEGYEDTLNNLRMERSAAQSALLEEEHFGHDYMLHYMLGHESRESLLNLDMFKRPFGHTLRITENNETTEQEVDLVETFNYLIGLVVKSVEDIRGTIVVQGALLSDDKVLIIWRDVEQMDNKALDEFFRKLDINTRDTEFRRIYVNGDNNLQNLRTDDETWKVTLIEEEFGKRMFECKDV